MLVEIHPYINITGNGRTGWTSQPLQTIQLQEPNCRGLLVHDLSQWSQAKRRLNWGRSDAVFHSERSFSELELMKSCTGPYRGICWYGNNVNRGNTPYKHIRNWRGRPYRSIVGACLSGPYREICWYGNNVNRGNTLYKHIRNWRERARRASPYTLGIGI